jgi:hypothetical protein
VQSVDSSLLAPIRSALGKWNTGGSGLFVYLARRAVVLTHLTVYLAETLPLAALQISLERVEDALRAPE